MYNIYGKTTRKTYVILKKKILTKNTEIQLQKKLFFYLINFINIFIAFIIYSIIFVVVDVVVINQ